MLRVGEVMDGSQQKILRRREVGVEDGYEFALGRLQALRQSARLETFAVRPVMVA